MKDKNDFKNNRNDKMKPAEKLTTINTDVLVIGGGFAGNFAAINAAETGVKVVMAVKGRAGRSGLTPWANSWFVFRDTHGVTREDYYKQFEYSGEYLCNMDFVDILMDESYDRYEDVSSWGAQTGRKNYYQPGTVSRSIEVVGSGDAMRTRSIASGVQMLERVMMTSLIKKDGKIEGAIGFHMESGRPYAVTAKATIICTGPASFKPMRGWPCSSATADGDAMAYRAGAEISGKEFNDGHLDRMSNPIADIGYGLAMKSPMVIGGGPPGNDGPVDKLYGESIGMRVDLAAAVHEEALPVDPKYTRRPGTRPGEMPGRLDGPAGPPPGPARPPSGGFSTIGMSNHKAEGLFPHDINGVSNIPGMWAAGDSLSSMQNGAGYAGFGCSCAGSSVQGARAGKAAAEFAKTAPDPKVSKDLLEELKQEMLEPANREKGYSPAWVIQLMQNIMFPYFITYVKEKNRLEGALNQIMYLQEKFAPELKAEDFHDLRVTHEARNMLLNAEMKIRAGLAREESRGTHYREDFPFRDDDNFLCWMKLVQKDGKMEVVKHPVPEKWHPDKSLSYREKYPAKYFGEDDYLNQK
ncbi:FAD-binding protein [Thermodesulfobacteriota bacterium]